MRIVQLINDNREIQRKYHLDDPVFGPAPEALLEGFKALGNEVEVHVVSCLQQMPRRSPEKLADNIFYHPLHVPKIGWLRTGYLGCMRATRRKIRELQPDIVHGQGTERDCAMCAVFSGYPNVLTVHGVMQAICRVSRSRPLSYYWCAKHLEKVSLRRTCGVVAISPHVRSLVSDFASRIWSIPNAVRAQFFETVPAKPRAPGPARLVNVGTISPNKRQLELLEVLSDLRQELPFNIKFIGSSNHKDGYNQRFKALLHTLHARYGSFEHHESLSPEDLAEIYDDSDALIHFSLEESFGLIFAEALARNLPLFSSNVGAVRQITEGAENCTVFNVDDFKSLIVSLKQWLAARDFLTHKRCSPNSIVASRYHPEVVAAAHLAVYRQFKSARISID